MRTFKAFLKKNWMIVLGLTLSVATILTFFLLTDGITVLKKISKSLQYGWLLIAAGFVVLQWAFDSLALHTLTLPHQPGRRYFSSFITTMVGILYSNLTPSATGGQPMQVVSLSRQGMETGTATSVVVVKTMLNQIALTIFALVMVFWELPYFQQHVSNFSFIVLFAIAVSLLFIAGLLLFTINRKLTTRLGYWLVHQLHRMRFCKDEQRLRDKMDATFENYFTSAGQLGSSFFRCLAVVVFTLLQLACNFAVPYCLYRSFGFYGESVVRLIAAATFVYFASMFVPVPGSSGGAEGSFYLFFSPFFPAGAAAPAMLIWRLLTYYAGILVGLAFTAMDKRRATPSAQAEP